MIVRKATINDANSIIDFQILMAKETEDHGLDMDTVTPGVHAVFEDPSKGQYWVAEENGQVIASLLIVNEWSDWRNGTVWWVHSVYVTLEHRKSGVFKKMFNTIKSQVQDTDKLVGLRLYVEKENTRAQKVYENLGMTSNRYNLYEWMKIH